MNERYILLTVLAVAAVLPVQGSADDGRVTLPYLDFQILWEAAQPEQVENEPPVGAAFLEARYRVDAANNTPVVEAELTAENFSGRWEWVAVAPASAALRLIDGATLAPGDDSLHMLLPVTGRHQSVAHFPAATSHDGALRFPVLSAASNLVVIAGTGGNGAMVVEGASPMPANESGEIVWHLPANCREVVVRRVNEADEAEARWATAVESLATFDSGWLDHETRIHASLLSGNSRLLRMPFPDAPAYVTASGEGLAGWEIESGGTLVLHWRPESPGREREVVLRYRIPAATGDEAAWQPVMPVAEENGGGMLAAVVLPAGLEIDGGAWTREDQSARLPSWIREHAGAMQMATHRGSPPPALQVRWLPRVESAAMTIPAAMILTRVVADGSQMTEARFEIEHSASGSAQWTLPEGMELLDAKVAGVRANPVARDGALEFTLPPPGDNKRTIVEFSYTGSGEALDRVAGGMALATPSTPLFARRIDWGLVLPSGYHLEAIESNAEVPQDPPDGVAPVSCWLRRSLSRDDALQAELFYRTGAAEE